MTMKVNRPKTSKLNNLVGGHTLTRLCAETMWTEFTVYLVCAHVCAGEKPSQRKTEWTEKRKNWPGVPCVSKPAPTAVTPEQLPAAPRLSAAELCQIRPTHRETATGGTPAWARTQREGEQGNRKQKYVFGKKKSYLVIKSNLAKGHKCFSITNTFGAILSL